jgi:antitoxin component YwqK of YwqJK toxin-antitoxin module
MMKKEFHDNGNLKSVYLMDTLGTGIGKSYHFYPDGTKISEVPYKGKMINGVSKIFYKGRISFEEEYVNDKQDGFYRNYSADGKIFEEGRYKNDLQDGIWNYYHNDTLAVSHFYKKGKLIEIIYKDTTVVNDERVINGFDDIELNK